MTTQYNYGLQDLINAIQAVATNMPECTEQEIIWNLAHDADCLLCGSVGNPDKGLWIDQNGKWLVEEYLEVGTE